MSRTHYLKAFAVYLLISLVMFWPVTLNLFNYVVNGHGDVYQTLFWLWWVPHAIFTLHQSPYFTNLFFAPVGANLATQTLTPIAGIISAPLQWISSAFAYNTLFFSSFALSGIFMFALANYFLKNRYAAFLAGLIYAFAPMHIAQSYIHLNWTIIEWVPLFLFFYIKTINEYKPRYALLAAVSFVLLTFMGDIEQGIMVFFAALILTILYFIFERNKTLNKDTFIHLGIFAVIALLIASPFLVALVPYLTSQTFAVAQQNTGILSAMTWSNNLFSFLLPSYYNGIFNGLSQSYLNQTYGFAYNGVQYPLNINERVSYVGYTVLALLLIGLYYDFKNNKLKHMSIWLIMGVIFTWLSIGPYLQVGSSVTGIPGIYLLYSAIPILNIIREPGRFDLIVTVCLAIMAGYGFQQLTLNKDKAEAFKMLAIVSILVLIEYNGMPLSGSFASQSITSTHIPTAYSELGKIPGNFTVMILPALPNASDTPALYTGKAMYYDTALDKPIISGYTSRENASQSLSVSAIPLADTAQYLELGYGLIYPSPLAQNPANLTYLWLADYNTAYVAVQLSAYNATNQELLLSYLGQLFGDLVYYNSTQDTAVFSTENAISTHTGQSLIAYTVGNWTSGYSLVCANSLSSCNQTLADMWWGINPSSLILLSPKVQNIVMSFDSLSVANGTTVGVYLGSTEAGSVTVTGNPEQYYLNMTVPQGYSEVTFYAPNSPLIGQYAPFGLENISFSPK